MPSPFEDTTVVVPTVTFILVTSHAHNLYTCQSSYIMNNIALEGIALASAAIVTCSEKLQCTLFPLTFTIACTTCVGGLQLSIVYTAGLRFT